MEHPSGKGGDLGFSAGGHLAASVSVHGEETENSIRYAQALNKFGTKVELHLFEKGGHGYGIGDERPVI
ncbi:MAG: hypothetical protein WD426_19115 [Anditalea sp.]